MQTVSVAWNYSDLIAVLKAEDWQAADQVTFDLMLEATQRSQVGWMDRGAMAAFPCEVLHQLDHLWGEYSGGHFGFSAQQRIYHHQAGMKAARFNHLVGWTPWESRLFGFFKPYNTLQFALSAPEGHLPALWFWELPWVTSWFAGGFGTGRGLGFGDEVLLDALMLRLERCSLV